MCCFDIDSIFRFGMMWLELAILLLLPVFDPHLVCKTHDGTLTIVLQSAHKGSVVRSAIQCIGGD